MRHFATTGTIAISLAFMAAVAPALAAPEPTLSDIAGCNEQAAATTGASALPHPGRRPPETTHRHPSLSPSPDATKPRSVPGPADRGAGPAPKPGPSAPLGRSGVPGEKTDPSGSIITQTPDPLLKGMDASKADDSQYRAAYRDCMRARLAR